MEWPARSSERGHRSWLLAAVLTIAVLSAAGCSVPQRKVVPTPEVEFLQVSQDIKLRRMIVRSPDPKGVVLFLHGFPETLYSWKSIALSLANDYDVHAFDWPGYGLSSRPAAEQFSYAPSAYATVLRDYITKAGIDRSKLVIYATDIGALPALLLALDDPGVAKLIIAGDFAPFDRPQYMFPSLQSLKSRPASEVTHAYMNSTRDEILENAFRRGLPKEDQFEVTDEFKSDMYRGWSQENVTSADALFHYYSHFTRDQNYLESNLSRLRTPVKAIWGEKDIYIHSEMGGEFARKTNSTLTIFPGVGHYPHLQSPAHAIQEVRSSAP